MAKKDKQKNLNFSSSMTKLKTETKHGIWAILFFVLALFLLMSMPAFDIAGMAGKFIYEIFNYLLGIGYVLLPLVFLLVGSSFIKSEAPDVGWTRTISGTLFLLSSLGIIDVVSETHAGGFLGRVLSTPLVSLFDVYASIVFLGAFLIISIIIMFDAKPNLAPLFKNILNFIKGGKNKKTRDDRDEEEEEVEEPEPEEEEEEEKEDTKGKVKKALSSLVLIRKKKRRKRKRCQLKKEKVD